MSATETPPPRRIYRAHREKQHRRILDTAGKLFDEHGIDRVTMADIISASGLRGSTMYQYFSNKDEIVWAIVREIMEQSTARLQRVIEDVRGPVLSKLAALMEALGDQLVNDSAQVRFMAQFDALYAREWTAERLLTLEAEINPQGFALLATMIRDGIADGSLRPDLCPELTLHAVINAVIGAQRRLASLGNRVETEYGQPIDRLFRETTRVILQGLQAT